MLRIVLLLVYVAYHLVGGTALPTKHGSGLDPLGPPAAGTAPSEAPPTTDHGSGLDPLG